MYSGAYQCVVGDLNAVAVFSRCALLNDFILSEIARRVCDLQNEAILMCSP